MRFARFSVLAVVAILGVAAAPSSADAALNAYLQVKGSKQGAFRHENLAKAHAGQSPLSHFSHTVISPRDAASGLPTGKRQHRPITVSWKIDGATPQIFQALCTNESLTSVKIEFWRTGVDGREQLYYTVTLTNASVSSYSIKEDGEETLVEASFTYERISVSYAGGVTAQDDWEVPNV